MNFPVFYETGPDSGSTAITLTAVDPDGNARAIETRGVLAHKAPQDSLGASEWTAWCPTPVLATGERVSRIAVADQAGEAFEYISLYAERVTGAIFGASGSDTTRFQLTPDAVVPVGVMVDFSSADFSSADFG